MTPTILETNTGDTPNSYTYITVYITKHFKQYCDKTCNHESVGKCNKTT